MQYQIREHGQTPLIISVLKRDKTCIQLLIKKGCDLDFADLRGRTPLYHAITTKKLEIVKMLVEAGCDINKPSKEPWDFPPIAAALHGHFDMVEYLLSAGAWKYLHHVKKKTFLRISNLIEAGFIGNCRFKRSYSRVRAEMPAVLAHYFKIGRDSEKIILAEIGSNGVSNEVETSSKFSQHILLHGAGDIFTVDHAIKHVRLIEQDPPRWLIPLLVRSFSCRQMRIFKLHISDQTASKNFSKALELHSSNPRKLQTLVIQAIRRVMDYTQVHRKADTLDIPKVLIDRIKCRDILDCHESLSYNENQVNVPRRWYDDDQLVPLHLSKRLCQC